MASKGTGEGSVKLPKRSEEAVESARSKPVWTVSAPSNLESEAPLTSVCDRHNRAQEICCRELVGEDERNLVDSAIVRDLIVGLADGLTVPFALTAGLSSLGSSNLVIMAGLAELFSGAISMGVGGFLASEAERDAYQYTLRVTRSRVQRSCFGEMERAVKDILGPVGVDEQTCRRVAGNLSTVEQDLSPTDSQSEPSIWRQMARKVARNPRSSLGNGDAESSRQLRWQDDVGMTAFILKFGEGKEYVPTRRLFISALTIGSGYFFGGLVPMLPYFFISQALVALYWSIAITTAALLIFGCVKCYYTGCKLGFAGYTKSALSTLLVGGAAAASAWAIVRALDSPGL